MERSNQPQGDGRGKDVRAGITLPLASLLGRVMSEWEPREDVCLWLLKSQWPDVCPELWAQDVQPERLEKTGKLVVRVVSAPGVAMEMQRKGRRWRQLLEGSRRVSGYAISDVVLAEPYQRRRMS